MDTAVVHHEWRNSNQRTNYPFADSASLTNVKGVSIDRDLFDDARLYLIGGGVGTYVTRITVIGNMVTFGFGDPVNGELATASLDVNNPTDELEVVDTLGRPAGVLISSADRLSALRARYSEGTFSFLPGTTEFDASVATPLPQTGVRGVILDDGSLLTGDLYLCGSDGVVLEQQTDGSIRVDIVGDPYALRKDCEKNNVPLPIFCGLRTINKISPDANGDYSLTVGANAASRPIIRIYTSIGQITIALIGSTKTGLQNG